jgi:transcriptional regulator with XRE-family HTH domain
VTQAELARVTGYSLNTLIRLEQQRVKYPRLGPFVNCAIALGVELHEVLSPWHLDWQSSDKAPEPPEEGWWRKE